MNKQVRELAEKIGYGKTRWNTTKEFENFLNQFAELIWQEAYQEGYDKGMSDCCDGQGGV